MIVQPPADYAASKAQYLSLVSEIAVLEKAMETCSEEDRWNLGRKFNELTQKSHEMSWENVPGYGCVRVVAECDYVHERAYSSIPHDYVGKVAVTLEDGSEFVFEDMETAVVSCEHAVYYNVNFMTGLVLRAAEETAIVSDINKWDDMLYA